MKEKIKCKKCGLLIDEDSITCPYCGYPVDKKNESSSEAKTQESNVIEPKSNKVRFFDFPTREINITPYKSIALFLIGSIGFQMFAQLLSMIFGLFPNLHFIHNIQGSAALNFSMYFLMFGVLALIMNSDVIKFIGDFKKGSTWLNGVMNGFFLIVVSSAIGLIFKSFGNVGVNNNEATIDSMTDIFPFLSVIVLGILGPICEELTYRAGLFNFIKKYNRIWAYLGTAIVFGLIHFDFTCFAKGTYVSELLNLPSYIVSGLLLSYFYEHNGLAASITAHATNNLFATLIQIIMG